MVRETQSLRWTSANVVAQLSEAVKQKAIVQALDKEADKIERITQRNPKRFDGILEEREGSDREFGTAKDRSSVKLATRRDSAIQNRSGE